MSLIQYDYSLAGLNTFGLKVRAARFAAPSSVGELEEVWAGIREGEKILLIGEGSNLLFMSDFEGIVIKPMFRGVGLIGENREEALVEAGAAENWDNWVETSLENGWYGLENLSLIPGTVGAAPVQNIGAYGRELKDFFHNLEAWDTVERRPVRLTGPECRFAYRNSIFKSTMKGRYVITGVTFRLGKQPDPQLTYGQLASAYQEAGGSGPSDLRKIIIAIRNSKLPDPQETGNAGSFFKNPLIGKSHFESLRTDFPQIPHYPDSQGRVKIPAAWLIEQAGWKGRKEGNVGTWPHQPLVIVNHGGATGKEIYGFSGRIVKDVEKRFAIRLEREVNVI